MPRSLFFCFVLSALFTLQATAQDRPILYHAGFHALVSSSETQPFWLTANRNGVVRPDQASGFLRLNAHLPLRDHRRFDYGLGADLTGYPVGARHLYIGQLYARVKYGPVQLYGGRQTENHGVHDETLSSGSLGWSTNALPMPKIGIALPQWTPLPFSRNFLHVKGHIAHGWFEPNRQTTSPWLHEKTIYGRIGGESLLNVYGGIMHYTVWAGDSPQYGPLPNQLKDFWSVLLATGGDEDAPPGEQDYMLGDHLGAWDFGFFLNLENYKAKVYRHFPLETKDNLKLKSPQDGLLGLSLKTRDGGRLISGIVYEHLYTKWQDGPRRPDPGNWRDGMKGNENYYNHSIYRSGWTNLGHTIGNPLLLPGSDPSQGGQGIINNRLVAQHFGVEGMISSLISYRALLTYSRNYGTYAAPFEQRMDQYSSMLEANIILPYHPNLSLNAAIGVDYGELHPNSTGLMVGVRWQ